jgi:hypothetical protein
VNWLMLTTPIPNCDNVKIPQANCPMAKTPLAGTGRLLGLYLNEIWSKGRPNSLVLDLYSNPHPSHLALAGNGAPHWGQAMACSETSCWHSRQGFICLLFEQFK